MIRDDFCAFILTHGRPERVHTYKTLKRAGYTGKIYIVIDDEDKAADEYRARFGDMVLQFCKKEIAEQIDEGDNFQDRRAIIYARNACWDLAEQVGCKYFIQLDDDYTSFEYRFKECGSAGYIQIKKTIDLALEEMIFFLEKSNAKSVAMSQGGDWIGGLIGKPENFLKRKAMNTFICSTGNRFSFFGRVNEDVNTYTTTSRAGKLFFTVMPVKIVQLVTQSNPGGMSSLYIDAGTYIKTFYSVMYSPSCVRVGVMGDPRSPHYRIHHKINWHKTAPKILREEHKKRRRYAEKKTGVSVL